MVAACTRHCLFKQRERFELFNPPPIPMRMMPTISATTAQEPLLPYMHPSTSDRQIDQPTLRRSDSSLSQSPFQVLEVSSLPLSHRLPPLPPFPFPSPLPPPPSTGCASVDAFRLSAKVLIARARTRQSNWSCTACTAPVALLDDCCFIFSNSWLSTCLR